METLKYPSVSSIDVQTWFATFSPDSSAGRDSGLSPQEEEDLVTAGVTVTQTDFEMALDNLQSAHSDSIGAPKVGLIAITVHFKYICLLKFMRTHEWVNCTFYINNPLSLVECKFITLHTVRLPVK